MSSETRSPASEDPKLLLTEISQNLLAEGEKVNVRYLSDCCRRRRFLCEQRHHRWRTRLGIVRAFLCAETRSNGVAVAAARPLNAELTDYIEQIQRRRQAALGAPDGMPPPN